MNKRCSQTEMFTAGALVAHLPEVVLAVEGQDPLRRQVLRPVTKLNSSIRSREPAFVTVSEAAAGRREQ